MEPLAFPDSLFSHESLQESETVIYSEPQGSWLFDSTAWDD
jgi:hypothetical protein